MFILCMSVYYARTPHPPFYGKLYGSIWSTNVQNASPLPGSALKVFWGKPLARDSSPIGRSHGEAASNSRLQRNLIKHVRQIRFFLVLKSHLRKRKHSVRHGTIEVTCFLGHIREFYICNFKIFSSQKLGVSTERSFVILKDFKGFPHPSLELLLRTWQLLMETENGIFFSRNKENIKRIGRAILYYIFQI